MITRPDALTELPDCRSLGRGSHTIISKQWRRADLFFADARLQLQDSLVLLRFRVESLRHPLGPRAGADHDSGKPGGRVATLAQPQLRRAGGRQHAVAVELEKAPLEVLPFNAGHAARSRQGAAGFGQLQPGAFALRQPFKRPLRSNSGPPYWGRAAPSAAGTLIWRRLSQRNDVLAPLARLAGGWRMVPATLCDAGPPTATRQDRLESGQHRWGERGQPPPPGAKRQAPTRRTGASSAASGTSS